MPKAALALGTNIFLFMLLLVPNPEGFVSWYRI
jgi:hypothetical protein